MTSVRPHPCVCGVHMSEKLVDEVIRVHKSTKIGNPLLGVVWQLVVSQITENHRSQERRQKVAVHVVSCWPPVDVVLLFQGLLLRRGER